MKCILTLLTVFLFSVGYSQSIKVEEKSSTFIAGAKNSIVVSIPHSNKDFVEKKIKDEVKSWGGKSGSSKGEYSSLQSQTKEIGEKLFDGFAKVIESKDGNTTVAFCFDLGGAFLTSSEHKIQYVAMAERIKQFAIKTAKECVGEELKEQEKILKSGQKDQEALVKDKATLESDIIAYKKKIEEAAAKIEQNKTDQGKKQEEIKLQTLKVADVTKKMEGIK